MVCTQAIVVVVVVVEVVVVVVVVPSGLMAKKTLPFVDPEVVGLSISEESCLPLGVNGAKGCGLFSMKLNRAT